MSSTACNLLEEWARKKRFKSHQPQINTIIVFTGVYVYIHARMYLFMFYYYIFIIYLFIYLLTYAWYVIRGGK